MKVSGDNISIDASLSGYSKRILEDIIKYPKQTNTQRAIRLEMGQSTVFNNVRRLEQLDLIEYNGKTTRTRRGLYFSE